MIRCTVKQSFSFRFGRAQITFHTEWNDKAQHGHEGDGVTCAHAKEIRTNIFVDVSQWRSFDLIEWRWWIDVAVDIVVSVFWLTEMVEFF